MAGDWLKVEAATPDKPEVFMIAERLGIEPIAAFGRLFLVWRWFDQHTRDGNAKSVSDSYLDHIAGVIGFAKAMREVGWLGSSDDNLSGLKLPNFERHNGKTAKTRALTAKRVATHKQRSGNGVLTHSALSREEKRRVKTTGADGAVDKSKTDCGRYWESEEATIEACKKLGISTRGESWISLKNQIRDRLAGTTA